MDSDCVPDSPAATPRVSDEGGDGVRSDPGVAGGDASQR